MANIYITDETKAILEKVAKKEKRGLGGEVHYLCERQISLLKAQEVSEVAKPANEVKDIKTPEEQQEVKPFDCGLDPETYDDGLIKTLNKIGADFQARIEKLEKGKR